MSQMSDYLEGELRKHIFRTGSFTKPSVLAIALLTAAPNDASTGATITEVANSNGYARQTLNPLDANWSAASSTDGLTDNVSAITFPTATGSWGTITHVAILDSATHGAGNVLFYGTLAVSKTVSSGDVFKFNAGDLDITFA
jgi:hypothetical protein